MGTFTLFRREVCLLGEGFMVLGLGFLQDERADVGVPLQYCPHFQEMPQNQSQMLHTWFMDKPSLKQISESCSLKHILSSLGE